MKTLGSTNKQDITRTEWQAYGIDTLFAVVGTMAITGCIYWFQLYPRIPNISITYLLVVLTLASTRGRLAAVLASLVAFLSFDFFIVPPLYTFTIARPEEWLALFVFMAVALMTGQLTVALRRHAQEARNREQETRILYELVGAANREECLEPLIAMLTRDILMVFASWGVDSCTLLLVNERNELKTMAYSARDGSSTEPPLPGEETAAAMVVKQGQVMGLHGSSAEYSTHRYLVQRIPLSNAATETARVYLIPLKVGAQVIGIVRLRIHGKRLRFPIEPVELVRTHAGTTAFFWTFLDQVIAIIERTRLRQEHMRMEVLQRTDELRSALLSSVSHDLRTPLASIKAAASSLLQEDVQWKTQERKSFVVTIEKEADRLNRLVSNLLDMSRIEHGVLRPEKELYPVDELLNDILARLQTLLRGRAVKVCIMQDVPPVEFDYLHMDQVLTNVIENAVRYTPPESPIEIDVCKQEREVLICVADRGPGIPRTDLERVFDKFYRVKPNLRQGVYPSGSGLGLAVCKGLVEAHGGRIWANARAGGGTIFCIALPLSMVTV